MDVDKTLNKRYFLPHQPFLNKYDVAAEWLRSLPCRDRPSRPSPWNPTRRPSSREIHASVQRSLENAGAYAAELECVPHNLARFLCSQTKMLLMSLGSGDGCDTQFLFSDDILGDYEERPPRHAKAYRNFLEENRRLQRERIAAFSEYISDVKTKRFPERSHLVEMDPHLLEKVISSVSQKRSP